MDINKNSDLNQFVHLHIHTEFSLVDGICRISQLVDHAKRLEMQSIAITDVANIYGAVKFYRKCVMRGIKPIIGVDLAVANAQKFPQNPRLILLCRNNKGYRFICKLLSKLHMGLGQGNELIVDKNFLKEGSENLIVLSGGLSGDIGHALRSEKIDLAEELIYEYKEFFPDSFYLEITRTGAPDEEKYLNSLVPLAIKTRTPLVASNNVRYINEGEYEAHEIRVCINEGRILDDPRRPRLYTEQQYLRTPNAMIKLFSDLPSAVENTNHIAKRCNVFLDFDDVHMPRMPINKAAEANATLEENAQNGLLPILINIDSSKKEEYEIRLGIELRIIREMGYADYFLIVSDFIDWAKKSEIPVGPGRGSGAGSLVAYALGITQLDPIKHGLLFERFLNPERISLPDFDIDFCMLGRDRVIEYVVEKYGMDKVAQIITFNSLAARAVMRDVGRVMGLPYGFCDILAKLVPFEVGMTLQKALDQDSELRERYETESEVSQLIDNARVLEGLPRNAGKHAGGIVIAPEPITEYTALYMDKDMTQPVTQFDKDDLEMIGLVKFDFLGLRTLTVIDWTLTQVNKKNIQKQLPLVTLDNLPIDDEETFKFIQSCQTTAIFQLESRGMRELIERIKPENFDDLIALIALFRPGPLQSGMVDDYIDRKHGKKTVNYPHPSVEEVLKPTYGVIIYQEQVMQIAQILGGYTLGAADVLRRAMGKKKPEEMEIQRSIFVQGAEKKGVKSSTANSIYDLMEKFAGYGFNKSHSAAYALLSYQTAWLKTYYPSFFMAAALSADMEHTDKIVTLIDECKKMGLDILPPNINLSDFSFSADDSHKIRYGLGAVKGVGKKAVDSLVKERTDGKNFLNIYDFCLRVDSHKCNKKACEALITAGAFDSIGHHRAEILANLPDAMITADQHANTVSSGQGDMFGLEVETKDFKPKNLVSAWSARKKLEEEKKSLGLYLSDHPISYYRAELQNILDGSIKDIDPNPERVITIAGLIANIRTFTTRRGDMMAFVSIDDQTAKADISIFGELYSQLRKLSQKDSLFVITGVTSSDDRTGELQVKATKIYTMETLREKALQKIRIILKPEMDANFLIPKLHKVLRSFLGIATSVELEYHTINGDIASINLGEDWRVNASDILLDELYYLLGHSNVSFVYDRKALNTLNTNNGVRATT